MLLGAALPGAAVSGDARAADPLYADFVDPPPSARPLVFWQWVNGNVTERGIRLDLQWMKRAGLAGALLFDIGFRSPPVPQYVERRVGFGTNEWEAAVRTAGAEARRLGLVLGAQSSGGWSVSGGPEVTAADAMKKLVWSETRVGPDSMRPIPLTAPPKISGPYQDVAIDQRFAQPELYADVAVIAVRIRADQDAPADAAAPAAVIDPRDILDLTAHFKRGALDWRPRSGSWRVWRFGWSLTGRRTVPATPESIGLEVDKLDPDAVRRFARNFHGRYQRALAGAGELSIAFTDSWEAGHANWTPAMLGEFRRRRGYDLTRWLPVLAGRVVGNVARSERVLADFRRTIADLVSEAHYGVLNEVAHARGMQSWSEAVGPGAPTIADGLQAKGRVDVPMGEYWIWPEGAQPNPDHVADVREAASAAHIYGRRMAAAESLTTQGEAPFAQGPREWRRMVDRFFAEGVNRVVLHTSVHQPFVATPDRGPPGITLRQYGQTFTRLETWADDASAWTNYLARASFLLQQGRPVADIAVFRGDDVPTATPAPSRPAGFDFDLVNAEVLRGARVQRGRLLLASGMRYRLLVRPPAADIHDSPLRRLLDEFARAGVPMIEDAQPVDATLAARGIEPDVALPDGAALQWIHRALDDGDVYFFTNQSDREFAGIVSLRVPRAHATRWSALDGRRSAVRYAPVGERTQVDLDLPPFGSCFLVLRGPAQSPAEPTGLQAANLRRADAPLARLDGPWNVEFIDGRGAPIAATFRQLRSWSESPQPGIRFYSGRARYRYDLEVPDDWLHQGRNLVLDLGEVRDLAQVFVNGRDLGTTWSSPDRVEVGTALRAGANRIEIVVTNYWANRMVGDKQPGARPVTFSSYDPFTATTPLRPAGLLGPVQLVRPSPQ